MTRFYLYGAIVTGLIAAVGATLYYTYDTGYEHGYREAEHRAKIQTDRAISELARHAESAHVAHDLCVHSGRVWSFTDNKCTD